MLCSGANASMIRAMISFFALAVLALDPSLDRLRAEDARLATIGWRLQTANAALCPGQYVTGLSVDAKSQYPAAMQANLALTDRPGVAAVARGSAAERAALKVGDVLIAINGQPTPALTKMTFARWAAMHVVCAAWRWM